MTTEFRLLTLERRIRPRPALSPTLTTFDPMRLTMREQYELDQLLAGVAPLPGGRWDYARLSDDHLDRLTDLTRKAEGVEPSAPYRFMKHRDPGIGECWCADCLTLAGDGQVGA